MKRLVWLAFLIVAACGSIGVQAQSITLGYKAGDTYKYAMHMVLKYNVGMAGIAVPLNMDVSAKETVTVKSVDSTGTADVSVVLTGVSTTVSMNGTTNTTTTTTPTTLEMKIASDGRVVSVNGDAFGGNSFPNLGGSQGGIVSAILPDKAVKPGDTWTKAYDEPNPIGTGSSKVSSNNTYLRDEKVGSINTAVVDSKINASLNMTLDLSAMPGQSGTPLLPTGGAGGLQGLSIQGTNASDVTSWIDTSARRLAKTHSTGTVDATMTINMAAGATTPGLSGPITLKGTQTLDVTPA